MATKNEINGTFRSVHPGEVLKLELQERGISQKQLAEMTGMQRSHISELLKGRRNMSVRMASTLSDALGISADFWLRLQSVYTCNEHRLTKMGVSEREALGELAAYDKVFDVRTAIKRLGVTVTDAVGRLKALKDGLRLPSVAEMQMLTTGLFRRSEKTGTDARMTMTWILLARRHAAEMEVVGRYNPENATRMVSDIRTIFNENKNTISRLEAVFSGYGIKFGVEKKVERASVDAYSFIDAGVPVIIVTRRYDRIDNLAFSVCHELGHIVMHFSDANNSVTSSLDIDEYCHSTEEREADSFASDMLIPKEVWKTIPRVQMNPIAIQRDYTRWAASNGINKWIALGRIAHETGMYRFKNDNARKIL